VGVAKKDLSGVFDADLRGARTRQAAVMDHSFHVDHNGFTFISDTPLAEWTEVGVEIHLPQRAARRDHFINCRAVVVQCARREQARGFAVALLFLDLPKRAQLQLDVLPAARGPLSISIAR
jgi:hypothetical protein